MTVSIDMSSDENLPARLAQWLQNEPLPGRAGQSRFASELAYGRQYGPPAIGARQAAVVVLLYWTHGHWHLPLTVRPRHLPDHAGQVSFAGGLVEHGEDIELAALRELEEELRIPRSRVNLLGRMSKMYVFISNFVVSPCVAVVDEPVSIRPNPDEVAELLEVPLAHLLDAHNVVEYRVDCHRGTFIAPSIRYGVHRVWGATGMIIGELIALLERVSGVR